MPPMNWKKVPSSQVPNSSSSGGLTVVLHPVSGVVPTLGLERSKKMLVGPLIVVVRTKFVTVNGFGVHWSARAALSATPSADGRTRSAGSSLNPVNMLRVLYGCGRWILDATCFIYYWPDLQAVHCATFKHPDNDLS